MARRRYRYSRRKTNKSGSILLLALLILGVIIHFQIPLHKQYFDVDVRLFLVAAGSLVFFVYLCKLFFKFMKKRKRERFYRTSRMYQIDRMDGHEFERFLAVYFKDLGYRVKSVGGSGDRGADLIITDSAGVKTCVQAKRYNSRVPFEAIQQVYAAKGLWDCDRALVITNNYGFTKQAVESAKKLQVELWGREKLMANMYAYQKDRSKNSSAS